jgi:hypothetical protein
MSILEWLLSKHGITKGATYHDPGASLRQCATWMEEWVNARITSGELRVARIVQQLPGQPEDLEPPIWENWYGPVYKHSCGMEFMTRKDDAKLCPGCGSQIDHQ